MAGNKKEMGSQLYIQSKIRTLLYGSGRLVMVLNTDAWAKPLYPLTQLKSIEERPVNLYIYLISILSDPYDQALFYKLLLITIKIKNNDC